MTTRMMETDSTAPGHTLENIGAAVIRYGLVVVVVWVGLLKFTAYEAEGVQGLVAHSPLLSWTYGVMSVRTFAAVLGSIEVLIGIMIALRCVAPKLSAFGSIGAMVMFLTTLSFALTTPGVWQPGYGFPFPTSMPGQFLAKDLVLLGAALWTAGEALRAASRGDFASSRA